MRHSLGTSALNLGTSALNRELIITGPDVLNYAAVAAILTAVTGVPSLTTR